MPAATGRGERRRRTTSAAHPATPATPARTYGSAGRTGEGSVQQHDGGHHGLDDLTAQPFPRHCAQPPWHVSGAHAVRDGPVHVAENPADKHGVEEQGTVVGADRAGQANADAECPGDDPPPPGRAHRSQGCEGAGGHDRRPGDRPDAVLERRRADQPHEKPQHGDAGGQAQQQRAEPADDRTDPDQNRS